MEEYFYRCKQILEEILTAQGFTEQAETAALGRSIRFIKDDLEVTWLYDLREQYLYFSMKKNKKNIGNGYFYNLEQLKKDFLPKLERMLNAHGLFIAEQNKQLAIEDLASF